MIMRPYKGMTKEGKWVYGSLIIHNAYDLKDGVHQAMLLRTFIQEQDMIWVSEPNDKCWRYLRYEVIPETVCQSIGCIDGQEVYVGNICSMEVWNGGDGIEEPDIRDTFHGVAIYDKNIFRYGLQTELCDEGHIEVGFEDSNFVKLEIYGTIHDKEK